ncbi:MAG: hypothetical protein E6R03_03805 [Hyphomicrobiaceae bacterium]|nr:MAG: hypothetical protein E6R03_03805 [Hyphomicrobiaceae bacterium]
MDSEFTRLERLLTLIEANRINAAQAVWLNLGLDFRVRIMRFVRELLPYTGDFSEYGAGVRLDSNFGEFVVSQQSLQRLRNLIPVLVAHAG